jgi:hypothetical protein
VVEARRDKPVTTLRTTVTDQHGTVVVDGTAVVYTLPLPPHPAGTGGTTSAAGRV